MRVLVVEDERRIAAYVKRGLEEEGYAVDVAYTGSEALDWVDSVGFDLILLDILLPELDGIAVCRQIRRQGVNTPILMLTAQDSIDHRVAGLDAGADDYLIKPFALKELLARLRALSRRGYDGPRMNQITIADLTLDTLTHRAERGGQEISLTAKEFAVLECLMRHPEQVLSRNAIAEHVWSYDRFHESNIVDVYIRNLRRKIDDPFESKLIQTLRGAGYRITAEEAAVDG
jgi:DNA-binding response OmpR family regulator